MCGRKNYGFEDTCGDCLRTEQTLSGRQDFRQGSSTYISISSGHVAATCGSVIDTRPPREQPEHIGA